MPDDVKYDKHYRDDPAACGAPFAEFEAFCGEAEGARFSTSAAATGGTR